MMSNTNVDYLFQLTAPSPDRGASGAAQAGELRSGFDRHLAHAAETSRDAPTKTDLRTSPENYSRPGDHQRLTAADSETTPTEAAESQLPDCAACGGPETSSDGSDGANAPLDEQSETTGTGPIVDDAGESNDNDEEAAASIDELEQNAANSADAIVAIDTDATATIDAATATPDPAGTHSLIEQGAHETTFAPGATTEEQGNREGQPANQSPALSSVKLATKGDGTAAIDSSLNPQEVKQAGQSTLVATAALTGVPQSQGNPKPGEKRSDAERNERAGKSHASTDGRSAALTPSAAESAKKSSTTRAKGDKTSTTNRRTAETSTSDEARGSNGSKNDASSDAAAATNRAVTAAIATPASTTAAAVASGNDGSDKVAAAKPTTAGSDLLLQHVGRTNRASGAVGRGGRSAGPDNLPRIDAARFIGRVAKAVQSAHEKGGALQLRLSPPELGSLRLELSVQNGVMIAAVETENSAARQVLLDHLPALRDRLAEQNIRVERFDVDVRQDGSNGETDPRASKHDQRQRPPHDSTQRQAANRPTNKDSEPREIKPVHPRQTNNGINVLA